MYEIDDIIRQLENKELEYDELNKIQIWLCNNNYIPVNKVVFKKEALFAKESGIKIGHVSDVLRKLKTKNLVECINEEVRKGRLYQLTEKGLEVRNVLR